MGFKKTFSMRLTMRLIFILITMLVLVYFVLTPGYYITSLLVLSTTILLVVEMSRFVSQTNAEISRFFGAVKYADYNQRFDFNTLGSGFGELGTTFTAILNHFQLTSAGHEAELLKLKALLAHVPVPLISLHNDKTLTLWNKSSQRLFGTKHLNKLADLAQFGDDFMQQVKNISPGEKHLTDFINDTTHQRLSITASEIIIGNKVEKLLSMQNIQSELDAAQLDAWQDLVRVLTHEIMNSLTPITSLAQTAAELIDDTCPVSRQDVKDAINTIATRSNRLRQFVTSYRKLIHLPPPHKKITQLEELFAQVSKLVSPEWSEKGICLTVKSSPKSLSLAIDPDMMEQVLINLLKNAAEAVSEHPNPTVELNGRLNKSGRTIIEVSDNGSGIPAHIIPKIFIPFFTTKPRGSGVGLALTRQIMIAHGGSVSVTTDEGNGTKFTLTFYEPA